MSISSVLKIGEALATWLNPERRERATLLGAINAAEQIIKILKKQDPYAMCTEKRLKELEVHYTKQFSSWKDGKG